MNEMKLLMVNFPFLPYLPCIPFQDWTGRSIVNSPDVALAYIRWLPFLVLQVGGSREGEFWKYALSSSTVHQQGYVRITEGNTPIIIIGRPYTMNFLQEPLPALYCELSSTAPTD